MRSVLVVTGYLLATYGLLYWHCRSIMSPDGRFLLYYCYSIVIVTLLLLLLLLCRVSVCPLLRSPYSVLLGYITRVNGWTNGRVLRVLRSTVHTLELHILFCSATLLRTSALAGLEWTHAGSPRIHRFKIKYCK